MKIQIIKKIIRIFFLILLLSLLSSPLYEYYYNNNLTEEKCGIVKDKTDWTVPCLQIEYDNRKGHVHSREVDFEFWNKVKEGDRVCISSTFEEVHPTLDHVFWIIKIILGFILGFFITTLLFWCFNDDEETYLEFLNNIFY